MFDLTFTIETKSATTPLTLAIDQASSIHPSSRASASATRDP